MSTTQTKFLSSTKTSFYMTLLEHIFNYNGISVNYSNIQIANYKTPSNKLFTNALDMLKLSK